MRIERIELWRLELELAVPLETSAGVHRARPLSLVRVVVDGAEGIGECSALAEPTYTEEYADGAEAVISDHLVPRLLRGGEPIDVAAAMARLSPVRGHHMAKAAIEMALLDATLKRDGRSLKEHLGVRSSAIPAGANVSLGTPDAVLEALEKVVEAGYRRAKVKIAPGADVAPLAAAREAFPGITLCADANGAYDATNASDRAALQRLDELGLAYLEQPLAPGDLPGLARLTAQLETPVFLDEAIAELEDLEIAAQLGAGDGYSVKLARLGGIGAAKVLHDRAVELGLALCIGGMLESGVGRTAAIALGGLAGFTFPGDLGASERYFVPDTTAPHVLVDGMLAVSETPGLGCVLDEEAIAAATTRCQVLGLA